jgi:hypothetical protein
MYDLIGIPIRELNASILVPIAALILKHFIVHPIWVGFTALAGMYEVTAYIALIFKCSVISV